MDILFPLGAWNSYPFSIRFRILKWEQFIFLFPFAYRTPIWPQTHRRLRTIFMGSQRDFLLHANHCHRLELSTCWPHLKIRLGETEALHMRNDLFF